MRIVLLSWSRIADDPRVRRQGDALHEAGHEVVGIGFGGAVSDPPAWRVVSVGEYQRSLPKKVRTASAMLPSRFSGSLAPVGYWRLQRNRLMYAAALAERPDRVHANDWSVLPIALRLLDECGAPYVYDSHEYGLDQNGSNRLWRAVLPPYIRPLEGAGIRRAAAVTTVADGIADLLQENYGLRVRPSVIRNMPAYQASPFRPTGEEIVVLYHGTLNPNRGLSTLVRSVGQWKPDRRLVVRGVGPPEWSEQLREAARDVGAEDRVEFARPVPMTELVAAARSADVGIHLSVASTAHARFGLPNKFFEYMMAGLALCVSDAPEMARLVHEHGSGTLVEGIDEDAVADAINRLGHLEIDSMKRRSLEAAKELCWDREKRRLLSLY